MRCPSTGRATVDERGVSRRRFFRVAGSLGVVATAGCTTDRTTGESDPADAVESYFEALEEGDRETANRYAHEDGSYVIDDDSPGMFDVALESETITITGPEEVDLETAVEATFQNPEADSEAVEEYIEREREAVETLKDEHGFEEYAYVRHEAETANGMTFNPVFLLFRSDSQWLIWSLPTGPARRIDSS